MHVDILSILAISEVSEMFSVKFQLSVEWKDQRLTFRNLKTDNFFNVVSMIEAENIWSPVIVLENTPTMKRSKVTVLAALGNLLLLLCITTTLTRPA